MSQNNTVNPENKCSHLFDQVEKNQLVDSFKMMYEMQKSLQDNLSQRGKGLNYDTADFMQKVNQIILEYKNVNLEMAELIERLPHKSWKTYSPEQKQGWESEEQKLETWFEYIDVFHFFMNIGHLLGISAEDFVKLYVAKNKENFDRQKRGY